METKNMRAVVTAKPVASRPSLSSLRSFSGLLASAINTSRPTVFSEAAVVTIRPKTVRPKPVVCRAPVGVISSQVGFPAGVISSQDQSSGTAFLHSSDEVSTKRLDRKSNVVYKPLAKLVSKAAASQLVDLGHFDTRHQEALDKVPTCAPHPDQERQQLQTPPTSVLYLNSLSQVERSLTANASEVSLHNEEENQRSLPPTTSGGQLSYDGYNWRKYGQKQVKGSEHPRSYYRCTHPSCPVRKMVERSIDGKIAEIVYKSEHNHPKPRPLKPLSSREEEQELLCDGTREETGDPLSITTLHERNEGSESGVHIQNDVELLIHPIHSGKAPVTARTFNTVAIPDNSSNPSGVVEDGSRRVDAEDDEPQCKQGKNDCQPEKVGKKRKAVREPRMPSQSSKDSEVSTDGFRWRKYGQKVVKGNPYPRSYYRCTNVMCSMRKHVERALDDPRSFITTYEGKHNHDLPAT